MGAGSFDGGNKVYLGIVAGTFKQRVKTLEEEGAQMRTLNNGNTVYEISYDFVEGVIKDVKTKDWEYKPGKTQKQLEITIVDDKEYVINTPLLNGYAINFIGRFVNGVGIGKRVRLVPYAVEDDNGKKRYGIAIWLDGSQDKKVKSFWGAPNNPEGKPVLPQWVDTGHKDKDGNTVWDNKAYYGAMFQKMAEVIDRTKSDYTQALSDYAQRQQSKSSEKVDAPIDDRPLPGMEGFNENQSAFEDGALDNASDFTDDLPF